MLICQIRSWTKLRKVVFRGNLAKSLAPTSSGNTSVTTSELWALERLALRSRNARASSCAAVEPRGRVAARAAILLDQREHTHHLREDEHLVALGAQLGQQLVEQHELARAAHQPLGVARAVLLAVGLHLPLPQALLRAARLARSASRYGIRGLAPQGK